MPTTNLGTILIGLGYDLSALEKGSPEAFKLINSQTLGMSAEMKRASREGAESFRLIDEALGIHLSRPLTRILTQEFPAFAKGLQSILGAGIVGALGVAGLEFFDKIAKSIEHAQKAQEEFARASRKTGTIFADAMASYEKSDKLRSLTGVDKTIFEIDYSSIDEARKHVDQLSESFSDLVKKQQASEGLFTKIGADVANAGHVVFNTPTELAAERIAKQGEDVQDKYDRLSKLDALQGTRESAKYVAEQLATAEATLAKMSSHRMSEAGTYLRDQLPIKQTGQFGYSEVEIDRATRFRDLLKDINDIENAAARKRTADDKEARQADALERMKKAAEAVATFYREIGAASAKLTPDMDPLHKLEAEIDAARTRAVADFDEMRKAGASALSMDHALAALDQLEKKFDSVLANTKAAAAVAEAAKALPTMITTPPVSTAPQFAVPGIAPTLGAGGTAAAQFDVFKNDRGAQDKLAAQDYEEILGPQQKFDEEQAKQNLLLKEGLTDQSAYSAAMQKAREEMAKATDQLDKLLAKTDSVSAGFRAFILEMTQGGKTGAGAFTFDFLNKGLQGFEDETVKALTGARANWSSFFESLDQMALKFVLSGLLKQMLQPLSANGGIFASLFGGAGSGVTSGIDLGALPGAAVPALALGIPGFASGTDFAPGGLSLVGENGPELVNLPTGASVTPNSASRAGHTVNINIDAKGGEIGVEEKIKRAISASAPQIVMRAVIEASEVAKRSPR